VTPRRSAGVDVDGHLDASILYETAAWSMLGDLLALKRSLTTLGERARRLPGWAPYYHVYKGSYHALRGEREKALEEHRRAFALVPNQACTRHGATASTTSPERWWTSIAQQKRKALVTQAISDVEGIPIAPYESAQLEMNLALAEASLGKGREATRHARHAMDVMVASGTGGVVLVEHHAKQALVALDTQDRATFRMAQVPSRRCARARRAPRSPRNTSIYSVRPDRRCISRPSPPSARSSSPGESPIRRRALGLRTELDALR